jgi:UPF0271 protein
MSKNFSVDLNCDLGESFGAYRIGNDEQILPYVTSANIACGFHAGDPGVMRKTVQLVLQHQVAIGAHPGLPDLAGFGRRNMAVSPQEVYEMVVYQIGALSAFVQAEGGVLHHVKPHGALYNMAAVDVSLAEAIAEAVYKVKPEAILYGLAGSELIKAPRSLPNALITVPEEAAQQVVRMIKEGKVRSQQGQDVAIKADTVCIHGDGPHALEFARQIRAVLSQEGITLAAKGTQNG